MFENVLTLLTEQINQYTKLVIKLDKLIQEEKDDLIKEYYISQIKEAGKEIKAINKKLKGALEAYFEYERSTGKEVKFIYHKLYKMLD